MEKVDLVIVGAEGVVESGGIINKVRVISCHFNGTCLRYSVSVCCVMQTSCARVDYYD